jgi:hypothetical protein
MGHSSPRLERGLAGKFRKLSDRYSPRPNRWALIYFTCFAVFTQVVPATAQVGPAPVTREIIVARLKVAYPDYIAGLEGDDVVFKDGTRLPFDDGRDKTFEEWLANPDIEDMFRLPYPRGREAVVPAENFDPGRARNEAFFSKIYGDCRKPDFSKSLIAVAWLPSKSRQRLLVTTINGVADKLKAISTELDALPAKFNVFLVPAAGAFNCRAIAGTGRRSAHGYGIAVDIAVKRSQYWRWAPGRAVAKPVYRNEIPREIVDIFEKHGFIWGGRWYHYDTMHFEYRPELLDPSN